MKNLNPLAFSAASVPAYDDHSGPSDLAGEIIASRTFLLARAFLLTQDLSAADDLVQDTLERALTARVAFRPGTNLKAWLSVILKRRFIDDRRHAQAGHRFHRELERSLTEGHQPDEEAGPVDLLGVDDVVHVMEGLSARDCEIFDLFYLRHFSYQEIAVQLGLHPSTVGTRLLRSRRRVRRLLEAKMDRRRAALGAPVSLRCLGPVGT